MAQWKVLYRWTCRHTDNSVLMTIKCLTYSSSLACVLKACPMPSVIALVNALLFDVVTEFVAVIVEVVLVVGERCEDEELLDVYGGGDPTVVVAAVVLRGSPPENNNHKNLDQTFKFATNLLSLN